MNDSSRPPERARPFATGLAEPTELAQLAEPTELAQLAESTELAQLAAPTELSPEDRELLRSALRQRQQEALPDDVRERLLLRLSGEARARPGAAVPARQLGVVPRGSRAIAWAAAAVVLLAVAAAVVRRGPRAAAPLASEPGRGAAELRTGESGHGRWPQLGSFRTAARVSPAGALPQDGRSLLWEAPFSPGGAWQLRRWDDPSADPSETAPHEFEGEALCTTLEGGERVVGGWPWREPGATAEARRELRLIAGRAYRLQLVAWASEPVPAELLIGVGHSRLPFSAAAGARAPLSTEPSLFRVDFVAPADDSSAGIAFLAAQARGASATRLCLRGVDLSELPRGPRRGDEGSTP